MLRSGFGWLFVAGVLVSTGLALNCYQCKYGFLRSNDILGSCNPSLAENVACPPGTEYCLKTDGPYNYSYSNFLGGGGGNSSGGTFLDCGTRDLIQFLFGRIPPASDSYCDDNIKMGKRFPFKAQNQFFGMNGTVCLCKGVTCNSGNMFSATAVTLMIPAVLSVMFVMKLITFQY
ncbi:uncharacterized protein LOC129602288 [Paramacrobiotus metropolitanus]|uniref:uncharacterized protein LOC129602288 n=1 Tax=Paramacrobiotus metropolitanus TaxID=2943436 RepID=UPI002445D8DC|nr:uncharacterized protein LOC129602288 [Paramacrobiotus metropolitanus]